MKQRCVSIPTLKVLATCVLVVTLSLEPALGLAQATDSTSTSEQLPPSAQEWSLELKGFLARVRFGPRQGALSLPQLQSNVALGLRLQKQLEFVPSRFVLDGAVGLRWSGSFRGTNQFGKEESVEPSSSQRRAVTLDLREFNFFGPEEKFHFLLGKAKIQNGPSVASSLVNPLAPEKDPVFPYEKTSGKWLLGWQGFMEKGYLGLFATPGVLENADGLPVSVWNYKSESWSARAFHAEATLMGYLGDAFNYVGGSVSIQNKSPETSVYAPRFGLMATKKLDESISLNFESSFRQGGETWEANASCIASEKSFANCVEGGTSVIARPNLDANLWSAQFAVGGKRTLFDQTHLSLEWVFNSAGETDDTFRGLLKVSDYVGRAKKRADKISGLKSFETLDLQVQQALGAGQKNVLRSKSSVLASLRKLPVVEGLWASGSTGLSLRDNSGLGGASVGVDVRGGEFELRTVFPYTLGSWKGVESSSGERLSESETLPYKYRIEARLKVVL